jgi:NTP pyrophosphatase (non-canonical NTP hydrolase)
MGDGVLTIRELQGRVNYINERRNWLEKHSLRSLSEAVVIEAAELLALSLWRDDDLTDTDTVASEIADVGIYLISLANHLHLDLADVILKKLAENETRFPEVNN